MPHPRTWQTVLYCIRKGRTTETYSKQRGVKSRKDRVEIILQGGIAFSGDVKFQRVILEFVNLLMIEFFTNDDGGGVDTEAFAELYEGKFIGVAVDPSVHGRDGNLGLEVAAHFPDGSGKGMAEVVVCDSRKDYLR